MFVEIITIGDELLIGQVVDTNSAWMGHQLNLAGFEVIRRTSVRDRKNEILRALSDAFASEAQVVLLTGGLGPTEDDITLEVLCDFFDDELILNESVYENVSQILGNSHIEMVSRNRNQAMVPKKAKVLMNKIGTAPITWFEFKGKILVSMPGVPQEMKAVMTSEVIPLLEKRNGKHFIMHRTYTVVNYPESLLADKLNSWEKALPSFIRLAYLPNQGNIRLRLTARGEDKAALKEMLDDEVDKLFHLLGNSIFQRSEMDVEGMIQEEMLSRNITLSTAESCTGGTVGRILTSLSGSSGYYEGGVITYSNAAKRQLLGVKESTLEKYGAVSEETVKEMAEGVRKQLNTTYGLAITGIAGPTGGTLEKPVGTVWLGVSTEHKIITQKLNFDRGREQNIIRSSNKALLLLYHTLLEAKNN